MPRTALSRRGVSPGSADGDGEAMDVPISTLANPRPGQDTQVTRMYDIPFTSSTREQVYKRKG